MKINLKIILLSTVSGVVVFILSSLGFFTLISPKYLGIPFQFVGSHCYGIVCTATPIFHWINLITDVIFWSVISYLLIKLMRSKNKK